MSIMDRYAEAHPVDPAPAPERWRLTYIGFRFDTRANERVHAYRLIDASDVRPTLGRELLFKKELLKASPGAIIEVDAIANPDGSHGIRTKDRSYSFENWRDVSDEAAAEVAVWDALDKAQSAQANAAVKSKVDAFEANLKPLRAAYQQLPAPARAILIAQVVSYISR